MAKYLLTPPVAFIIILLMSWLLSFFSARIAYKPKDTQEGTGKAYACGEDTYDAMVRPDYSQFFIFAYFFTLAHVAVLIVATMPKGEPDVFGIAFMYIVAVIISLLILFRRGR